MASSQSFSMIQRRMLLSPWPASPVNSDEPLWTSAMRLPSGDLCVHLRRHVGEEEHLAVAGAGDEREFLALVHHLEARVAHAVLAAHRFEVLLPALAVGRIGEHEVELLRGEGVVRERGPFRAADDVVGALAFAFQQHVGLADGVGFGVDLLAVEQAS